MGSADVCNLSAQSSGRFHPAEPRPQLAFEHCMGTRIRRRTSSQLRSLGDSTKKLRRTKTKRKRKLQSTGNAAIVQRTR